MILKNSLFNVSLNYNLIFQSCRPCKMRFLCITIQDTNLNFNVHLKTYHEELSLSCHFRGSVLAHLSCVLASCIFIFLLRSKSTNFNQTCICRAFFGKVGSYMYEGYPFFLFSWEVITR